MEITKVVDQYRKDLELIIYASNTIKNYVSQVTSFLHHYNGKFADASRINEQAIKDWLILANTRNSRAHRISALKLFYKMTIKQPLKFKYIEYPRSEQKLPQPLSEHEVQLLFEHCHNTKHKAILALLFFCGMRVGEVINLKPQHINRQNMVIHVIAGKGKKDRAVPMSAQVLELLERYYREYKPTEYFFNGQFGPQYTATSVNQFIKQIGAKAGIKKHLHAHLGRHSCFSQMLLNGVDMALIQATAGHANIKTTQIYAKVTSAILNRITPYSFAI